MRQLVRFTVVIVGTGALMLGAMLWRPPSPNRTEEKIVVVDRARPVEDPSPMPAPPRPAGDGGISTAQKATFAASFTKPTAEEEFNWQNSSSATQGFSDRTGPPTLPGGGFNASPDEKPLEGEALDIP